MWNRVELKEDSKNLLRMNYWPFVLVALVHSFITGGNGVGGRSSYKEVKDSLEEGGIYRHGSFSPYHIGSWALALVVAVLVAALGIAVAALVLDIFVLGPLEVGCKRYMTISREVKPQYGEMLFAFKNCYGNVVKTMFMRNLFIFLWSLLLVIPGIVKSYEYRMVPYLMAEYPDMASTEAFRISREMMAGNKWEAFVLDLSFIGWNILSAITFGLVGIFYSAPYQMLTDCALYLTLKKTNPTLGYVQPDGNYYYNGGQY